MRAVADFVIARSASDEAIQRGNLDSGLLRFARDDGSKEC
jgi:hypothetical protein